MACPQCSRRLLKRFIQSNNPLPTATQRRWMPASNQLPIFHVRWITNTQRIQLRSSRSAAEQSAAAEAIPSTHDTVTSPNSGSSLPQSAGDSEKDPDNLKNVHESIRKELYEYLETQGVDTELLRPQLDSIPISAQLHEDPTADGQYSIEPDWRQIQKKHPRKKAQSRYRNDLARLTGQAPLYGSTNPEVGSVHGEWIQKEELAMDRNNISEARQTSETGSYLKASLKKDSKQAERVQARKRLRAKVKVSTEIEGDVNVKPTKRRESARATRGERRSPPSEPHRVKEMPPRILRDQAEKQDHASTAAKNSGSNRNFASASKSRSSEGHPHKRKEHWQIDKAAIKEKIGGARWDPKKKLSPDAREGIRTLNAQYPDKFTTPVLAKHFEISSEAVRRILKSKWKPSADEEEERQARWNRRGEKIWTDLVAKGVNPPKRWRDMGIVQGQSTGQRQRTSDFRNAQKSNNEIRSEQSGSEWIASLPARMV